MYDKIKKVFNKKKLGERCKHVNISYSSQEKYLKIYIPKIRTNDMRNFMQHYL